jgi:hypothetical protein
MLVNLGMNLSVAAPPPHSNSGIADWCYEIFSRDGLRPSLEKIS